MSVRRHRASPGGRLLARALMGVVVGGLVGGWVGVRWGGQLTEPAALDPSQWHVVTPVLMAGISTPDRGRGVYVQDGALVLVPHAFRRDDVVRPVASAPVGAVVLELADNSASVRLILKGQPSISVGPHGADNGRTTVSRAENQPWTLTLGPNAALTDGAHTLSLGAVAPAAIEIGRGGEGRGAEGIARLTRLEVRGVDGEVLAQLTTNNADAARVHPAAVGLGALLGLLVGGLTTSVGSGVGAGLLALLVPLVVSWSPSTWLALQERFYLVRLAPWELARLGLGLGAAPLLGFALYRGLSAWTSRPRPIPGLLPWLIAVVLATALAMSGEAGGPWWLAAPLVPWLLLPWWIARRAQLDEQRALILDLPALLVVAAGGASGLLLATGYRLLVLLVGATTLLQRAPKVGADAGMILLLSLIPAAELGVRATWLNEAWDPARYDLGVELPDPYHTQSCEKAGAPTRTVLYLGGSSTGGAYQFAGEPTAFFAGQAHTALCALPGLEAGIRTVNLGNSGRDSFTFATYIDTLLNTWEPDVVLTWFGVNDLTADQTVTRKEAWEARQRPLARAGAALREASRLWSGLSLATRGSATGLSVPGVPLDDARENHRRIASAALERGARVILMTEHTDPMMARTLAPYAQMIAAIAAETGARALDLRPALAARPDALADQNHLTRAGSKVLAELLVPEIKQELRSLSATGAAQPSP